MGEDTVKATTTVDDLVGRWVLRGHAHLSAELPFDEAQERVQSGAHNDWLCASGVPDLGGITPSEGLILTIGGDATFSEAGSSAVTTFDADGVEVRAVEPFGGALVQTKLGVSVVVGEAISREALAAHVEPADRPRRRLRDRLFSRESATASEPSAMARDAPVLRISDDVDIAETFEVANERLIRTQNAVTDGLYATRLVFVYERSDEAALIAAPAQSIDASADREPSQEQRRLEREVVADVLALVGEEWERVVLKIDAHPTVASHHSFLLFYVHRDAAGTHSIAQPADTGDLHRRFAPYREASGDERGEPWGTAILIIDPPGDASWELIYQPTTFFDGPPDDTHKKYTKYLPYYLAEKGFSS